MGRSEIWSAILVTALILFIVWGHSEYQQDCRQFEQVEVTGG
jgi:hypothetical protein